MHEVEPEIHLIASTTVDDAGLQGYLDSIGALGWETDAPDGVSEIIEVMSRSCYKSFGAGLNPNVTRVREGDAPHIENVIRSGHDSVLEHGWASFMFTNVSRVFTHELVRHRAGVAISQESLRYVRIEDIGMWVPSCFADLPGAVGSFRYLAECSENAYQELLCHAARKETGYATIAAFDSLSFTKKKEYTSAARRVLPIGLATNIGWSCNMRALRHVIEMRTEAGAEEEIQVVFGRVAQMALEKWPNLFYDLAEGQERQLKV